MNSLRLRASLLALMVLLSAVAAATGCGNKGDLVRPAPTTPR